LIKEFGDTIHVATKAGRFLDPPGAKTAAQARDNAVAGDLEPLDPGTLSRIEGIYDRLIRGDVHHRW
jgi:hypothetical protein